MKRFACLFSIVLAGSGLADAQSVEVYRAWEKEVGTGGLYVAVDDSSNVLVGSTRDNVLFTTKLDRNGEILWQVGWNPGGTNLNSHYIGVDDAGNVYHVGSFLAGSPQTGALGIVVYDRLGSLVNEGVESFELPVFEVSPGGGLFGAGLVYPANPGCQLSDLVLVGYFSDGYRISSVYSGATGTESPVPLRLATEATGNFLYVAGVTRHWCLPDDQKYFDGHVWKFNEAGTLLDDYPGGNTPCGLPGHTPQGGLYGMDSDRAGTVYWISARDNCDGTAGYTLRKAGVGGSWETPVTQNHSLLAADPHGSGIVVGIAEPLGTSRIVRYGHMGSVMHETATRWYHGWYYLFDPEGNMYFRTSEDRMVSYDSSGNLRWEAPGYHVSAALDREGNLYQGRLGTVRKLVQKSGFVRPADGDHFLPGRRDSIVWNGGPAGRAATLEYSTDLGATYHWMADVPADLGTFAWDVPDTLLSPRSRVRLSDSASGDVLRESEPFRIKPYVITRIDGDGEYVVYDPEIDRWGFENREVHVWPPGWWNRFDYQVGLDPFTGLPFDNSALGGVFAAARAADHPDWTSWVRAFGVPACYSALGGYRLMALERWDANKDIWGGSCFGIATSNALAFERSEEFLNRYPQFPAAPPILVQPDATVIPGTVNELFSHQYGNPNLAHMNTVGVHKTPNQTLVDLKEMLSTDETVVQALSFLSNNTHPDTLGGHTILAYGLVQDDVDDDLWHVQVYDNSRASVIGATIEINTRGSGGKGTWKPTYGWPGWGGDKWFFLENPASDFLSEASLAPKSRRAWSPFVSGSDRVQIYSRGSRSLLLSDDLGRRSGFTESVLMNEIPDSSPIMTKDGAVRPPGGYELPAGYYTLSLGDFSADTVRAFFFSGNRAFDYLRGGIDISQTDSLRFDGGLVVSNGDEAVKTVRLQNIVSEQTEERLLAVRNLELARGDSVRLENLDDGLLRLDNGGGPKRYGIALEYVSDAAGATFEHGEIELPANTRHIYVPDWQSISTSDLLIYVDTGRDGTVEDTLRLGNQGTASFRDDSPGLPRDYRLDQNYPNPFRGATVIPYALPRPAEVVLTVYDVLGRQVRVLTSEPMPAGSHTVVFDAADLPAGVYFYRIEAGGFGETRMMTLLR